MIQVRRASLVYGAAPGSDRADRLDEAAHQHALDGVSLDVAPGELVSLIGDNGSGKSTLGRLLCGQLLPCEGSIAVDGLDTREPASRTRVRELVGMVCQNPLDQLVSSVMEDEVAFGPRNIGCNEEEVAARVSRALAETGLTELVERDVNDLSGGEQQRLALAGVLALEPSYLVLDEITSMLDSGERPRLRALVRSLVEAQGVGVVQITHDAVEVLASDRVVLMEQGRIIWEGTPYAFVCEQPEAFEGHLYVSAYARCVAWALARGFDARHAFAPQELARWACERGCAHDLEAVLDGVAAAPSSPWPTVAAVGSKEGGRGFVVEPAALARPADVPTMEAVPGVSVSGIEPGATPEVITMATRGAKRSPATETLDAAPRAPRPLLEAHGVCRSYEGRPVLSHVDLSLCGGRVFLLAGASGSGKSTLARLLAGLEEPDAGAVSRAGEPVRPGKVALAFQNPEAQLFLPDVRSELAFAPRNQGLDEEAVARRVVRVAADLGLDEAFLASDPFALSGGQARRAALGGILALDAPVLVLDEPTAGLDARARRVLHDLVAREAARGRAVLVISHDLEEWLPLVDEAALMREGTIVWQGEPVALADDAPAFRAAGLEPPEAVALREGLRSAAVEVAMPSHGALSASAPHAEPPATSTPYEAHRRLLGRLDARAKIVGLIVAIAGIFATQRPEALAVWGVLLVVALAAAGAGPARFGRAVRPALILLAFIVAANAVSCDGSAGVVLAGPVGIDAPGAARALGAVARIVLMLGFSLTVTLTTDAAQIADACVRLLRPLGALGLPVDELGVVLALALRFMPIVSEELVRVRHAQEVRGVRFDEGPLPARIRAWSSVLVPAVVGLFRRADRLGASMDARCYASSRRCPPAPRPLGAPSALTLVLIAALALALALAGR